MSVGVVHAKDDTVNMVEIEFGEVGVQTRLVDKVGAAIRRGYRSGRP